MIDVLSLLASCFGFFREQANNRSNISKANSGISIAATSEFDSFVREKLSSTPIFDYVSKINSHLEELNSIEKEIYSHIEILDQELREKTKTNQYWKPTDHCFLHLVNLFIRLHQQDLTDRGFKPDPVSGCFIMRPCWFINTIDPSIPSWHIPGGSSSIINSDDFTLISQRIESESSRKFLRSVAKTNIGDRLLYESLNLTFIKIGNLCSTKNEGIIDFVTLCEEKLQTILLNCGDAKIHTNAVNEIDNLGNLISACYIPGRFVCDNFFYEADPNTHSFANLLIILVVIRCLQYNVFSIDKSFARLCDSV